MKRLLLVSQRPQQYGGVGSARWNAFRSVLPELGWEVEVVSARANPTANEYATDTTGQRLYAARAAVMGRAGGLLRPVARAAGIEPEALAPSAVWGLTGRRAVRRAVAAQRPDVVWATSPPIAGHLAVAGLDLGVPLVCELRDHWAGNPYYDAGGSALRRIEGRALAHADAVVVVTPPMRGELERMHPHLAGRVHVLPNGFEPSVLALRAPRRSDPGPLTLVHAGPLHGYPGRTIAPLLAALRALPGRFHLRLIGADEAVPGAEVLPRMPWEDAIRAQAEADVGLVLHSSDRTALGTKVFELLALGRPVLALVEEGNALDALLRGLGQGAGCARHDDPAAIAAALERLAADPPPPVDPERLRPYDRTQVARDLVGLLESL